MDATEQRHLLGVVEHWVRAKVQGAQLPPPPRGGAYDAAASLFVTLRVGGELRGCIGTLEARAPAGETALDMAGSALRDPRFRDRAVRPAELDALVVELMLLGPAQPIDSPAEMVVGRDGIIVRVGSRSGVFLPQVAVEHGWTAQEAVENCCRHKLGLSAGAWRLPDAALFTFEGTKVSTEDSEEDRA